MISAMKHIPVMENEVIDLLNIKGEGVYVDCTLGGGGHTMEILKQSSPKGMVIAIEPMVNIGTGKVTQQSDGWTIQTADKSVLPVLFEKSHQAE